jgi:hypothetical protein
MARWFRFLIAILIGVGLGLAYGWFIAPVRSVDNTPDKLRIDYKTDFVLMVAEAYQNEEDPGLAARRLATLGEKSPVILVEEALQFAQKAGYSEPDISRMQALLSALQTALSGQEKAAP